MSHCRLKIEIVVVDNGAVLSVKDRAGSLTRVIEVKGGVVDVLDVLALFDDIGAALRPVFQKEKYRKSAQPTRGLRKVVKTQCDVCGAIEGYNRHTGRCIPCGHVNSSLTHSEES